MSGTGTGTGVLVGVRWRKYLLKCPDCGKEVERTYLNLKRMKCPGCKKVVKPIKVKELDS